MSAEIIIITDDRSIITTSIFIARIISAVIIVIAINWSIYTSESIIARLVRTFVIVIAVNRDGNKTVNGITSRYRTELTTVGNWIVNASKDRIASVSCADVFIITVNCRAPATSLRITAPSITCSSI